MSNCNLSLKVLPMVGDDRLYSVVDQVIKMLSASGVKYLVGPNETSLEGDIDELLPLVKKAQEVCVAHGAGRVVTVITMEYCPDGVCMDEKLAPYR